MKNTIKTTILAALLIALTLLAACGTSGSPAVDTPPANTNTPSAQTPSPVSETADTRADWPEKLIIVQMPDEGNPDAGSKNENFRTAIEAYLGIKVEEIEATEYAAGIEAIKNDKLDILLVSPMSFYQADRVAKIEPLVTTRALDEQPYKTVFVTRAERDDINSIEDLEGKTFAFVDPASSSGYMYPKAHLITRLGLDADTLENPGYFFETVTYSGKHDTSLMGVSLGDYDAAAVAYQVIAQLAAAGLIDENDIKIVGETELIPNACYVMRQNLPQSLKDAIRDFYLSYDDAEFFKALYGDETVRFIEAKASDYDVVTDMIRILKIEE